MTKHSKPLHVPLLKSLQVKALRKTRDLSLNSQTLFNKTLSSKSGPTLGLKLSSYAAAMQVRSAQENVPAYEKLLAAVDWKDDRRSSMGDRLKLLPETDKKGYINNYSIAERCSGGIIPLQRAEIDESSGSSGKPYNWIRGTEELTMMRRTLSRLATYMYGYNIVTINGFSMGAWATGTNVSMSLVRNGLLKSTGPDPEKMISVLEMLGTDRTYVITGYPPFMLELIEFGLKQNFPWKDYTLIGIVGGEAMSETLRSRLLEYFQTITSAYGASDLDIGVACEFPLCTWIRQQAFKNPELAARLFGDARRLPMLFQYDPIDYYVEQNKEQELVVTVNRPSALSPRLRYNVHDIGGNLNFAEVISICKSFGLDPLQEAPLPYAGVHPRLPFLFIGGRSDSTMSYLGANIYPEDIDQALFADAPVSEKGLIKGFSMELVESDKGEPKPNIYIELQEGLEPHVLNASELSKRVVHRLTLNSRDFKASVSEDPKAADIKVEIFTTNTGPFEGMNSRIKRKYIITK
jgi:phenylacetate-CoA ligase